MSAVLIPIAILLGIAVFGTLLGGIIFFCVAVLGGWATLAKRFPAPLPPPGSPKPRSQFSGVRGTIGTSRFGGLGADADPDGLVLRFAFPKMYPPLLIPWTAFADVDLRQRLGTQVILRFRERGLPTISLHGRAGPAILAAYEAAHAPRHP